MRKSWLTLALLCFLVSAAAGDGLILNDGRKLSGRVAEKPDGYEITVDGQLLSFPKEEVKQWIKSHREILGDADKLLEEAKTIYLDSTKLKDANATDAKLREAAQRLTKVRDAYVEAQELFPESSELSQKLIQVMSLYRLVRGGMISHVASGDQPVKTKDAPPPKPIVKEAPPPPPVVPEPPPTSVGMSEALAILADPVRRADPATRAVARSFFRKASGGKDPLADLATAGFLLLSRFDEDWQLLTDTVTVKTSAGDTAYKGRLEKESDAVCWLVLPDQRRVRIRTAPEGTFVTPPGGSESKPLDCKIAADQKSESFDALQSFFKGVDAAKMESLSEKEISEGVKVLGLKVKELRAKNLPVDALTLLVAGAASALIAKNEGKPTADLEAAFKDLGFEKSEFGAVWGRKEGLAMDDYRKWVSSADYGLAIVQFTNDYRGLNDVGARYAMGLLWIFKALSDNRSYSKAAAYLEGASRDVSATPARDHFLALAKSIRDEAPCHICGGTHQVNCTACKGKTKLNLECNKCGGSGKLNTFRGIQACSGCGGKGRFINVACPKCKASGKADCKARGCTKATGKPTFESFADAYKCSLCQGRGSMMRHVAHPCTECTGVGLILAPKIEPAKLLK